MFKKKRLRFQRYAALIRDVARTASEERAAKCGFDLMCGLAAGDSDKRENSWKAYLVNYVKGQSITEEEERDGVWVPAIFYDIKNMYNKKKK